MSNSLRVLFGDLKELSNRLEFSNHLSTSYKSLWEGGEESGTSQTSCGSKLLKEFWLNIAQLHLLNHEKIFHNRIYYMYRKL